MLKITLDYWNFFVPDVFSSAAVIDANAAFAFAGPVPAANRRLLYAGILSKLRQLCITRMAKPEEARPAVLKPATLPATLLRQSRAERVNVVPPCDARTESLRGHPITSCAHGVTAAGRPSSLGSATDWYR